MKSKNESLHISLDNAGWATAAGVLVGVDWVASPILIGIGVAVGGVGAMREKWREAEIKTRNVIRKIEDPVEGVEYRRSLETK